ncbi:hypothetical protein Gogos_015394 [Gossypium gossypioides]|uniref:Isopenicillin N synthase-like Fe(2+) 2OG dioxygenase domain-containing protein n=1 Tax=Gossypium gossypioides TaxID=34282 RepID=A0A7J9C1M4_GOSGO|nr:hypothetical protein [Gossypium gossypioides]
MILESFGLEKYMDELSDSTNNHLRAMKYGRPNTSSRIGDPKQKWRMDEFKSFTQLFRSHAWRILQRRLSSCYHRVLMEGNKARYSIGLFARPRGGYLVKVPKELVDDKNPMLFKPFDLEEFLKTFSPQIVQGRGKSALKAYCSV